jgi:threonine/homoserine efflux transporter RhtA
VTPDPNDGSLFTKPDPPVDDSDPGSDLLTGIGCTLLFGAFFVFTLVSWDSIALDPDSFAGGRTASMRKLLGRIGQIPVAVVLALITLFSIYVLVSALRARRDSTPD